MSQLLLIKNNRAFAKCEKGSSGKEIDNFF